MAENMKPVSLAEGHVYIDGIEVMDGVKCTFRFVPKVWSGTAIGKKGTNRRWINYDITGTLDEYKTTPRWTALVKKYLADGITPELTIQGTRTDKDSDYYEANGSESGTVTGCVITGEIPLLDIDTDGDVVKDSIAFGAKNFV
ncbi:MAG: phage tail tube protein [Hespellia sp.]|nr:phage tail tube protein [Hespellia sp.]